MLWCDPAEFSGAFTVDNEASLAVVDATRYQPGTAVVYVGTYRACFMLVQSTAAALTAVRVNALNLPGYQWIRFLESRSWWNQLNWLWDPSNVTKIASDENDGATSPVKTCDEIQRRMFGRYDDAANAQNLAITQLSDGSDTDQLFMNLGTDLKPGKMTVTLTGTIKAVPVGTITNVVLIGAPIIANSASLITVPGFDFSPYIGNNLHLVGSVGTMVAAIEAAPSVGMVQVSERYSGAPDTDTGFVVGNIVEIPLLTKIAGICVRGANVFAQDCKVDKSVGAIDLIVDPSVGSLTMTRCELRGSSIASNNVYCKSFGLNGGSIVGSSWEFNNGASFNTVGGAAINVPRIMIQSCDLRHHVADFGLVNSMIYGYDNASIRLHGNFHCFGLKPNAVGLALRYGARAYISGLYYGTGNDALSAGVCMTGDARFRVQGVLPNMDAGKSIVIDSNDEPTTANNGGTTISFASMPYPSTPGTLTPRLSAAVFG